MQFKVAKGKMKPENRLCLWCQHISFEAGFAYSEVTWNSGTLLCDKDKFHKMHADNPLSEKIELFRIIQTAKNCDSFELDVELEEISKEI